MSADQEWGYTFDRRVAKAMAVLLSGRRVPLSFHRFGPPLDVGVFVRSRAIRGDVQAIELLDARGRMLYPEALEVTPATK